MSLHFVDQEKNKSCFDVYTKRATLLPISKYKLEDEPQESKVIRNLLIDELLLDGNAKQNLATFCQTDLSDESIQILMNACVQKNLIDKDEYPQMAEIEKRCVNIIGNLWNSPDSSTVGCSTTGSSEAAMLGGLALKKKWIENRKKQGKPIDKPNLVTGPVQVCWHKFALYFDIELREVPMEENRLCMTPKEMLELVDENTIGVVPTLGLTFTLQYENVKAIAEALDKYEKETGIYIPIHVDAASGGFVAPFLQPDIVWDFRLSRVKSINASGHKFGLTPLGCGWVVWNTKQDLHPDLVFNVNYLGGNMPTFSLNFSKPGGQVVCQYYNFLRHGRSGFTIIHQTCVDHGIFIGEEVKKIGIFDLIYDGRGGLPGVVWVLKKDAKVGFNLFDLSERMRSRGWQVAAYALPKNAQNIVVQRVVIRHGFSRDMAQMFIEDINRSIDYFAKHPMVSGLTQSEGQTFHH
ncbi:hypothetical protein CYY_003370 [Polysphondylium violaceum]|uniref:Glutamate decarboxylase n=1 Tax=Polysphondylium violaceum TaxID=133409 RepID=A0A8J4Q6X7_9MYCE|nr:hypothetical protein CYY_003370 [Polysphondylium violaceum]